MNPILSAVILAASIAAMWSAAADTVPPTPATTLSAPLTKQKYNQIHEGMTIAEVLTVVGCGPTEHLHARGTHATMQHFQWQSETMDRIRVLFKDGVVISFDCTDSVINRTH